MGPLRGPRLSAVRDATFEVGLGEVVGLVGPNRAGKTTLIKMLLTLTRLTRGEITRLGEPAHRRGTLARVGYLHDNQAFPRYLSARNLLLYYGQLGLIPSATLKGRVEELLGRVGLADRAAEPISRFSKGMVQRLALAQALLAEPDLLVLDEPMEGLDLVGRRLLHDVVRGLRNAGKSALFVSHSLVDVEEACDRLVIIYEGRLRFDGTVKNFLDTGGSVRSLERVLQDFYQKQTV